MDREPSKREQKRTQAQKARDRAIYSKKAVRIQEARALKNLTRVQSTD
jgi:hypothetical protein